MAEITQLLNNQRTLGLEIIEYLLNMYNILGIKKKGEAGGGRGNGKESEEETKILLKIMKL